MCRIDIEKVLMCRIKVYEFIGIWCVSVEKNSVDFDQIINLKPNQLIYKEM